MFGNFRIGVVIPARNEEALVARVVMGLPPWVDAFVVIDDGSLDDTATAARAAVGSDPRGAVDSCAESEGVGAAIRRGYAHLLTKQCDVLVVMAGDDQMDPADLPALVSLVCSGRADYATGDRFSHPELRRAMPLARRLGGSVLTLATRRLSGYAHLKDAQCGYTAISAPFARALVVEGGHAGYGYPNDVLARLAGLGARHAQTTVRPIYGEEDSGLSAGLVLATFPGVLWRAWWARRRLLRRRATTVGQPSAALERT